MSQGPALRRVAVYALCTVSYALHAVLTECAKDASGRLAFDVATVVGLSEVFKLLVSLVLMAREPGGLATHVPMTLRNTASVRFAVPALLYAFNNQLAFWLLHQMDPATMQLLSNFKVVPTVLLSLYFIGGKLSGTRWLSLLVLFCATLASHNAARASAAARAPVMGTTTLGLLEVAVYCTVSGVATTWNEKVLKEDGTSIHVQNASLYIWGVACNFLWVALHYSPGALGSIWGVWPMANLLNQSLTGLLVSVVLKYGSHGSIDKLFIVGSAVLPATVASCVLFEYALTDKFLVSAALTLVALMLYAKEPNLDFRRFFVAKTTAPKLTSLRTIREE